jgi:hypothetical protein
MRWAIIQSDQIKGKTNTGRTMSANDTECSGTGGGLSAGRLAAGLCLGFAGSLFIWIAAPYTRLLLRLENISDSYLPVVVLLILVVLGGVVNPLLARAGRGLSLNRSQLALIAGMMLMATVLPVQGVFYTLPYSLATTTVRCSGDRALSEAYVSSRLQRTLFPDSLVYGSDPRASERFLGELLPGERIPWGSWAGPAVGWGSFVLFFAIMSIGLAMIVLPQWRRNERLAFPLVGIYESLLDGADVGSGPSVFRRRSLWIGFGIVFFLYALRGLNGYFPESVPAIPLSWNLRQCFTEEPLLYLPPRIYSNQIYFSFVAIAFFMPTRISFSIWFMMIAYTVYIVLGRAYFPPFHYATISDHRSGAMLVLTGVILWLGRRRWAEVGRRLFSRDRSPEAHRDRIAAACLAGGAAGMFAWFLWGGAQAGWAAVYVCIGAAVSLLVTRFVAETGMPFIRTDGMDASLFIQMAPAAWTSTATAFFSGITWIFFQFGSRVNIMAMGLQALALSESGDARRQSRRGILLAGVVVIGFAVCGAVHLWMNYHHSVTLDGVESPIAASGGRVLNRTHQLVLSLDRGQVSRPTYSQGKHILFGACLAGALQWASLALPTWPLHPIGLFIVFTYYGQLAWASIFIGWLLKVVLVRYGGSRLYREGRPFFLGLVLGEVFSTAFWCIVSSLLVFLGKAYVSISIQPG